MLFQPLLSLILPDPLALSPDEFLGSDAVVLLNTYFCEFEGLASFSRARPQNSLFLSNLHLFAGLKLPQGTRGSFRGLLLPATAHPRMVGSQLTQKSILLLNEFEDGRNYGAATLFVVLPLRILQMFVLMQGKLGKYLLGVEVTDEGVLFGGDQHHRTPHPFQIGLEL